MGEPAGIGPDITLAAWQLAPEPDHSAVPRRRLRCALARARGAIWARGAGRNASPRARTQSQVFDRALPVHEVADLTGITPGVPDPRAGTATIAAIETAVALTVRGEAGAVVTNPIAKSVLYAAGFAHPGHTEFLADLAQRHLGQPVLPVMMIASDLLRVVPLTIHLPLAKVPAAITPALLMETVRITAAGLRLRFRHRPTQDRRRRPEPARWRVRHDRRRGGARHRAGHRRAAGGRPGRVAGPSPARTPPTRCFTRGARPLRRRHRHVSRSGADARPRHWPSTPASTSPSACRSCARRPITARPSISPARASPRPKA